MNEKEFFGVFNAPSEKRYKNFVWKVVDNEEVWMLSNEKRGCRSFEDEENIYYKFWPAKEFAEYFKEDGDFSEAIEVHEFCDKLKEYFEKEDETEGKRVMLHIFPNEHDAYAVDAYTLYWDIMDALEEVE
ncbi:MAG: DUF2750 domain-containing protein [Clostridia bacterium]|nr:DUF2750 domain-containing protein [Clostridia bacterium]